MKKILINHGRLMITLIAALLIVSVHAFAESDALDDPQTGTKTANSSTMPTVPSEKENTVTTKAHHKKKKAVKPSADGTPISGK